jgi:AraC-like DNA-binding protein
MEHPVNCSLGMPPLAHLTNWRMLLAERDRRSGASIAEAADAIGYTSESAFSNAFKRAMGVAPGRYRDWSEATTRNCPHYIRQMHLKIRSDLA